MDSDTETIEKKTCFVCGETIPETNFAQHVSICASKLSPAVNKTFHSTNSWPYFRSSEQCFNCSSNSTQNDDLKFVINCPERHVYCFPCLYKTMHEFIANSKPPMCHSNRCNYQLARYELEELPLNRKSFNQLCKLIKTERRPKCPKCKYFVNIDRNSSFDEHVETCQLADSIPCEFCSCPQLVAECEAHERACRSDRPGQRENLINFVLSRTQYPFSHQQIVLYIDKLRNRQRITDPHEITDSLATFGQVFPYELPKRTCDICANDHLLDDIFVFGCDQSHKLCYECYEANCRANKERGDTLKCCGCDYVLNYGELHQLRIPDREKQKYVDYQVQKTFENFSRASKALIKCSNQQCKWAFEPNDPNERFCVRCPACKTQFCSLCNQQYHYRTRCDQLAQFTQRWFFWCNTERVRYLQQRAKEDQVYGKRLAEYEKHSAANRRRNDELRQRYQNTMADEQYKAQNCRLCPHCRRVVQHMGGCASMICGQDYHGGNNQSGCGKSFTWDQAQPYSAAAVKEPREVMNDLPRPKSQVVVHENINCDICHELVRGIRFECVHCPSLIYCEKCEQQATLNHSDENRQNRSQQHVFRLIMKPGDELIY